MGDFEKKFPASACRKKKIACSTNVIESLWEKKEKNILPTILLGKKILDDPPPPSRVKWSAPYEKTIDAMRDNSDDKAHRNRLARAQVYI